MKAADELLDDLAIEGINFQNKCLDKMMHFKKNRVTIVFVSHSMPDVEKICERVMWIENHITKMIGRRVEKKVNLLTKV